MLIFKYIIYISALLGLVASEDPARRNSWVIIHQLLTLQAETQHLYADLTAWDRTMIGAFPISTQTEILVHATRNATITVAETSKFQHIAGAFHIRKHTSSLIEDILKTVGYICSLKEDFHNVGLAQTVVNTLIEQQTASQELNDAVVLKLPRLIRFVGKWMGCKTSKIFQDAIDEYRKFLDGADKPVP